jgi:2-phosphosulfolactate phosphatase
VGTLEKAREYKKQGYMVAAERDGIVRDFADFGNSPFNFTKERVSGKEIVYSTTNGTNSIMIAKNSHEVLVGAFLNLSAIAGHLQNKQKDVIILCAGWKSKFNLEDTLFAGALANELIKTERFDTICDATHASMDLWSIARNNLLDYIEKKAAQKQRLKANNLDDVIEYCCTLNMSKVIPILKEDYLVDLYS